MMPNTTYELRKLYFEQSQYSAGQVKPDYKPLLQWPGNEYFEGFKQYFDKFKPDSDLLQNALIPDIGYERKNVSEQIFGNQMKLQYVGIKHIANLFYERCKLHKQHMQEMDQRHIEVQERKFGVEINNFPDRARRLSNLENQLLQLEGQRRDEELAFWKDTVELREKLFANAGEYRAAKHR